MSIMKWTILLSVFVGACFAQRPSPVQNTPRQEEAYRILTIGKSAPRSQPRSVSYRISVHNWLQREDFEKLICKVIDAQKPSDYDVLTVSTYYRLDEYIVPNEDEGLTRKYQEHSIGRYTWNRGLPGNRFALAIFKDQSGVPFPDGPRFCHFDHFEDCK